MKISDRKQLVEIRFIASLLIVLLSSGCNRDDKVVAEANRHKLYLSEVRAQMPNGLSVEDSALLSQKVIDDWITEELILAEAEKQLSPKEKNFNQEIANYRRMLLKQRYFEKITSNPEQFKVSDDEVRKVIRQTAGNDIVEKEIVKLNYVKLHKNSPILQNIKDILFDDTRRMNEKAQIETLCADTIEYFIEDNKWLFWDDIQAEVDIDFNAQKANKLPLCFDQTIGNDRYLIVILDYKSEQTAEENDEYFESVRTMLIQQKKTAFINQEIQNLKSKNK